MVSAMDVDTPLLGVAVRRINTIKPKDAAENQILIAIASVPDSLIHTRPKDGSRFRVLTNFFRNDKMSGRSAEASVM